MEIVKTGNKVEVTISIRSPKGEEHLARTYEPPTSIRTGREKAFANEVFADISVVLNAVVHYDALPPLPRLTDMAARDIHGQDFAERLTDFENTHRVWTEIHNTLVEAKWLFARARAYKDCEPPSQDQSEAGRALRYYTHTQKMERFDLAVINLIRVQDLIARLLFECFSGRLPVVDLSHNDWERKIRKERLRENIAKAVRSGDVTLEEDRTINRALDLITGSGSYQLATEYRNCIAHRVRPSVDYVFSYMHLGSRLPVVTTEPGAGTRDEHFVLSPPSGPIYEFWSLYREMAGCLSDLLHGLESLKSLPRLA